MVECVGEPPKLLRLRKLTLHLAILVVALLPLEHLELARRVLDPALDHVDLVAHQPEALLHLLLHPEDLLRDQGSQRGVGAIGLLLWQRGLLREQLLLVDHGFHNSRWLGL